MNLNLAVTYAEVPGFPAGSAVASYVAVVTGAAAGNTTPVVQTYPAASAPASFVFPLSVADTYTYSISGQDASGNTFGAPVTGSFAITAPATISLNLPSAVVPSQS